MTLFDVAQVQQPDKSYPSSKVREVMNFILKGALQPFKPTLSTHSNKEEKKTYKKGVIFVTPTKEHLVNGKGHVITSVETLLEQYKYLSHWTPNAYYGGGYKDFSRRYITGHSLDNLKQINVITLDIDIKRAEILYALFLGCDEWELPRPNLILETPRGYQVFFVLDKPIFIRKEQQFNGLSFAKRLSSNIRLALKEHVQVDTNATYFGFFRMPNDHNIVYYDENPICNESLFTWSKEYEKQTQVKRSDHFITKSVLNATQSSWYYALMNAEHIKGEQGVFGRNNAILTLALANYADGVPYADMFDELDQFNSKLESPLTLREFVKTVKSAYSGKYKGPKKEYVQALIESAGIKETSYLSGVNGFYKHAKLRKDRERSHYDEWENDILTYMEKHTSAVQPFLEGSLKKLAALFGMAVSSLREVLKRSKRIVRFTVGVGRKATTTITSRKILVKHYVYRVKRNKQPMLLEKIVKKRFLSINDFLGMGDVIQEFSRVLDSKEQRGSPPITKWEHAL
ncbi:primase C-terminal domain-containing protein [Sutcliffiella rhizosphaerae]|uniref:Primase C-terminal 1 domain-containing protein n=1 Tax=Sutcliffiella rhizosphaerae TaxID=2880967 RepID=A0ABN8AGE2_9BACI|nr:primase C-terminal domain-containing protein [Sutcliffiella rhizosphaerae]CAG9622812.1 hypothetical protein BACCIP111883_03603 [Sutcliffiella rhizosphaerae]